MIHQELPEFLSLNVESVRVAIGEEIHWAPVEAVLLEQNRQDDVDYVHEVLQ